MHLLQRSACEVYGGWTELSGKELWNSSHSTMHSSVITSRCPGHGGRPSWLLTRRNADRRQKC
jgi:hypothetical protein